MRHFNLSLIQPNKKITKKGKTFLGEIVRQPYQQVTGTWKEKRYKELSNFHTVDTAAAPPQAPSPFDMF
jgi:hypothetical protein